MINEYPTGRMIMKKFSVIIPAYNCGAYISDCLKSIKSQTYKNYEIIVVNDNSTDATGIVIAKFIRENPQIDISVIYNEANLGVSASRNKGIKKAQGEFILFADADDFYCDSKAFENFESNLSPNTDILIFGCNVRHLVENDKEILPTINFIPKDKDKDPKTQLSPLKPLKTVWQLCFRREFLLSNDIFFQEDIKTYEDVIFRQQAVAMSKQISTMKKVSYTYNRRIKGAKSLTINKDNSYFGELNKLVKAIRRVGELSRQYKFPEETEKYFKRTVLLTPQAVFHITTETLFAKLDLESKTTDRNHLKDTRER